MKRQKTICNISFILSVLFIAQQMCLCLIFCSVLHSHHFEHDHSISHFETANVPHLCQGHGDAEKCCFQHDHTMSGAEDNRDEMERTAVKDAVMQNRSWDFYTRVAEPRLFIARFYDIPINVAQYNLRC
ncbi:MAG: hypothetical protein J6S24_07855 [Lentisphaeria bacterium]|nr:hypothetical protein [Lentisphaeria bacterium]MBO7153572.1 hypothetical protein [Lentisphaeria bacterium]